MRIEIFVVETEINPKYDKDEEITEEDREFDEELYIQSEKDHKLLEKQKMELIRLFGGFTETNFKGFWCNHKTNTIDSDVGKIWLIYAKQTKIAQHGDKLTEILLRIKKITKQNVQAYAINNEIYYI